MWTGWLAVLGINGGGGGAASPGGGGPCYAGLGESDRNLADVRGT